MTIGILTALPGDMDHPGGKAHHRHVRAAPGRGVVKPRRIEQFQQAVAQVRGGQQVHAACLMGNVVCDPTRVEVKQIRCNSPVCHAQRSCHV